jgi:hypothetical protein
VWAQLRRASDGLGWTIGPAVALLVFALFAFLFAVQSQTDRLIWTGAHVIGDERQGLVFYSYKGQNETLDVHGTQTNHHYDLYVDRSEPNVAVPYSAIAQYGDILLVFGPVVLAAGVVTIGVTRRRRQRRAAAAGFGKGLDDDFVQRKLGELRGTERT